MYTIKHDDNNSMRAEPFQRPSNDGGGCEGPSELCECCISTGDAKDTNKFHVVKDTQLKDPLHTDDGDDDDETIKELAIIGAGPHALALLLRLLEPEADLMSDKERHLCADYHHRMRPLSQVRKHIQDLFRGPKAVLKQKKKSSSSKTGTKSSDVPLSCGDNLPAISLDFFRAECTVVDAEGSQGWLASWERNFDALQIKQLRSPISAHCDPYDHRGLELYAEKQKRNDELVPLDFMSKSIERWDFHGPFNAPSTKLFHDFHHQLTEGYGISDVVEDGRVVDVEVIKPSAGCKDPIFVLSIEDSSGIVSTLKTKRLVCALGPAVPHNPSNTAVLQWEATLKSQITARNLSYSDYILQGPQILEWLSKTNVSLKHSRILIVGGGITSGHLALVATAQKASVTFIQRSPLVERQFDVDPSWMGPRRGMLQDEFAALPLEDRSKVIKEARRGGSISPEVVQLLSQTSSGKSRFAMNECTEIHSVDLMPDGSLEATLSDFSCWQGDMIWLATGFANKVENHPILEKLSRSLPIQTVNGLPALNTDLSWGCNSDDEESEEGWKLLARRRCWVMGAMAALELGPDALNLMGARRGAVHVSKAIRSEMAANATD